MTKKSVIIIGGGVIGLFSAYYLQQSGNKVTIVDSSNIPGPQASSYGNAGMIVPSHFVPLANKSAIKQALQSLFKRQSPIGLKWRLDPEFLKWIFEFQKAAFATNSHEKRLVLADISLQSRDLYKTIQDETGIPLTINLSGLQMVCRSNDTYQHEKYLAEEARKLNIPAEIWTRNEFIQNNPELNPEILGAVFYPLDGMLDPYPMQKALVEYLQKSGVEFIENSEIQSFVVNGNSISGIQTSKETILAEHILLTTGDQTGEVVKRLGLRIPLLPGKGLSYQLRRHGPQPSFPTLLQDEHIAITPYAGHVRVAGKFILGDRTARIRLTDLLGLDQAIKKSFPDWNLGTPHKTHAWAGYRPVSPDGLPIIGKSMKFTNLYVATGHAMTGLSLAPYTGRLIGKIINNENTEFTGSQLLRPDRFGNYF